MSIETRLKKLEKVLLPEPLVQWVRIILEEDESEEDGVSRWQQENEVDTSPKNIIFRVIV